jgi:hypothetical protein
VIQTTDLHVGRKDEVNIRELEESRGWELAQPSNGLHCFDRHDQGFGTTPTGLVPTFLSVFLVKSVEVRKSSTDRNSEYGLKLYRFNMVSCEFLSSEAKYMCLPDTVNTGSKKSSKTEANEILMVTSGPPYPSIHPSHGATCVAAV